MRKYHVVYTASFKRSYKRARKRGQDLSKLELTIDLLASGNKLPVSYNDHALTGNWAGHRECHIEPDWLLVYYKKEDVLVLTLVETGSHSDLFKT